MAFLLDRLGDPLTVFDDLMGMQDSFNRLFSDRGFRSTAGEYPPIKVWGSENGIVVDVEAPGVDPKDVDLSIDGTVLTVKGRRSLPEDARERAYHSRERFYGEFSRSLTLPYRAETGKVKAAYRHGVLRVRIPRAEEDRPKRVALEVN